MIRILFQGDSITDGNRLKEVEKRWDLNHQIGHSYVFSVTAYLNLNFPGKYAIVNRGISGDTVDKMIPRWQVDTLDEHPDVLSILVGINGNGNKDGTYPDGVEEHLNNFDSRYRWLLDSARAQNENLKIVLVEPFCLPVEGQFGNYNEFIKVFSQKQEIIRRIAEDYGAIFVPVQKRLDALVERNREALKSNGCPIDPLKYWLWDGVHPTEQFHGYLAELWLDATKEMLAGLSGENNN